MQKCRALPDLFFHGPDAPLTAALRKKKPGVITVKSPGRTAVLYLSAETAGIIEIWTKRRIGWLSRKVTGK